MNRGALQCPARLVLDNWKKCRRNNFKYKDKSDIKQLQKLTFFLKKLDEEFYSGLNLSDGERLRLARYMERFFCDCLNFEKRIFYGFDIPVLESLDFWILHFVAFFPQSLCI